MSRGSVMSKERRRRQVAKASRKAITWSELRTEIFGLERSDGRAILCYVTSRVDGKWIALAIEGRAQAMGTVAALDDHGHRLIGTFTTPMAARRAAETFGRRWLRTGLSVDACPCEEIPEILVATKGRKR